MRVGEDRIEFKGSNDDGGRAIRVPTGVIELDHGYLTIARIAGDPAELLRGHRASAPVMNGVGRDHGLLVHVAAATDDGLLLINVWPSPERSESAARDPRRLETIRASGLTPPQFEREHHEAAAVVLFGAAGQPADDGSRPQGRARG